MLCLCQSIQMFDRYFFKCYSVAAFDGQKNMIIIYEQVLAESFEHATKTKWSTQIINPSINVIVS